VHGRHGPARYSSADLADKLHVFDRRSPFVFWTLTLICTVFSKWFPFFLLITFHVFSHMSLITMWQIRQCKLQHFNMTWSI